MSEIDVQNAKQIRDPMTVLITMEVPDDEVTLTYSGYSSAKVADGALNNDWPMRGLADLQGDGFPLDGSRVLYDPNTPASAANGKIGIRSNIGEPVSVTVTGNRTITSLSIFASGAESVTFGGTTTPMIAGSAVIPVGARSITLTLSPASSTERIEVSEIRPGTVFRINNDNLIRAVVSLRSDLSIINPTLPESEINIDVYQDTDIAEIVANIPEDTPITYQAGYPGDMSPVRNFYVTGQVTWADNVLSIQGVDAVHFLDVPMQPLGIGTRGSNFVDALGNLVAFSYYALRGAYPDGGDRIGYYFNEYSSQAKGGCIVTDELTVREMIATLMNLLRFHSIDGRWLKTPGSITRYVLDYVDAGIPTVRRRTEPARWQIQEEDCSDPRVIIEREIGQISYNYTTATGAPASISADELLPAGSCSWIKDVGASLTVDDYCTAVMIGVPKVSILPEPTDSPTEGCAIIPVTADGADWAAWPRIGPKSRFQWMQGLLPYEALILSNTTAGELINRAGAVVYTQFVPWDQAYDFDDTYPWTDSNSAWTALISKGIIDSGATEAQLDVYGRTSNITEELETIKNGDGISAEFKIPIKGVCYFTDANETVYQEAFPKSGVENLFTRSNVTGSFRWKGDPRHQPRDVATFVLRDGTEETITLENITITHEGGGTYADYTYRKGIV